MAFTGAACKVLGDCRCLGVGGCSAGELAEMAEADREHPTTCPGTSSHGRRVAGWLGWPERRRAVIATTVFAKGFGKPTCCQISELIIFFKIKGIIFVLRTSSSALSLLPSLSLSHTHTRFLLPWGILAAQGSEKQTPTSFPQAQGKQDAL